MREALAGDLILDGARPLTTPIDMASFEPLRQGEPWLRGQTIGIPSRDMRAVISGRDLFRPSLHLHAVAQDALQKSTIPTVSAMCVRPVETGFDRALIERNDEKFTALVTSSSPLTRDHMVRLRVLV